jgi:hypothetical protein
MLPELAKWYNCIYPNTFKELWPTYKPSANSSNIYVQKHLFANLWTYWKFKEKLRKRSVFACYTSLQNQFLAFKLCCRLLMHRVCLKGYAEIQWSWCSEFGHFGDPISRHPNIRLSVIYPIVSWFLPPCVRCIPTMVSPSISYIIG